MVNFAMIIIHGLTFSNAFFAQEQEETKSREIENLLNIGFNVYQELD
tara:strand:- start:906 stop:1046 length:141 start_codon:yes stop_codon:yes gene_type:complete